jgi:outer membrane lipoprotein LolB
MINWKHLTSLSFVVLTACAPPQAPDAVITSDNQTQALTTESKALKTRSAKSISSWTINGAIAAKNKKEAWSASLNWKQNGPSNYQIRLFGPLGGGSMLIEKKGSVITYQDAQKRTTSNNADDLVYKQTGTRIPIQNLYYWMRGLPAPGAVQSAQYDQAGRLSYLKQAGYTIQYMRYTNKQGVDLPSKLHVRGTEGNLKLIVKRWNIR